MLHHIIYIVIKIFRMMVTPSCDLTTRWRDHHSILIFLFINYILNIYILNLIHILRINIVNIFTIIIHITNISITFNQFITCLFIHLNSKFKKMYLFNIYFVSFVFFLFGLLNLMIVMLYYTKNVSILY